MLKTVKNKGNSPLYWVHHTVLGCHCAGRPFRKTQLFISSTGQQHPDATKQPLVCDWLVTTEIYFIHPCTNLPLYFEQSDSVRSLARMLSPPQVLLHQEHPKLATDVFLVGCMLTVVSPKFLLVIRQHIAFACRRPMPSERNYNLFCIHNWRRMLWPWFSMFIMNVNVNISLISFWMSLYLGHWQ